jgi:murein DD-endopeptidase MepM/ murein hydrolase activator NlpD
MDENLKLDLGRKSLGFLLAVFLFSGPVGGEELNPNPKKTLFDLLQPVVKTVMLAAETEPAEGDPSSAAAQVEYIQPRAGAIEDNDDRDLYRICWGDTCWSIARRHGMSLGELAALNPGLDPEKIKSGDYLLVRRMTVATSRGRSGPRSSPLAISHPLPGARLTSKYGMRRGRMHWGIDLAAPAGTPVLAATSGIVTFSGWKTGYGLIVELDHGSYQTKYAHNTENLVRVGDKVRRSQPIAKVGQTGNATGNHLHFELVINGEKVDPLLYL